MPSFCAAWRKSATVEHDRSLLARPFRDRMHSKRPEAPLPAVGRDWGDTDVAGTIPYLPQG